MIKNITHPLALYLPLLIKGDYQQLLDLFAGAPLIDDPRLGRIEDIDGFKQFVAGSHQWLTQRRARIEHIAATQTDTRAVEECVLHLVQDGVAIPLPVAIVSDIAQGLLTFARVYHSMWPLLGAHVVRPPLLPNIPYLAMPDVIAHYQKALANGDLEAILRTFEPDGIAREPSGGKYIYRGTMELRRFYGMLFANAGGIPLEHCSVTDDRVRCAVEYNAIQWGRTKLPPQAGVAVYERGRSGLLAAARIYDDVDPPL